jgi:hypothetical protein
MSQYIKQVASPQILNEAWLDLPRDHNDWWRKGVRLELYLKRKSCALHVSTHYCIRPRYV